MGNYSTVNLESERFQIRQRHPACSTQCEFFTKLTHKWSSIHYPINAWWDRCIRKYGEIDLFNIGKLSENCTL